jgi:opacity protein-like surface antigen
MLSAAYAPVDKLFLNAGVSLTKSTAVFDPDDGLVTSFSDIDLREVVYSVSAEYEIKGGWGVGAGYEYADFDNLNEDPENLFAEDGTAHVISVTARKKW